MSIDQSVFRKVLGRFATGITVVTALDDDRSPIGLTVNAFTSLSLDPPLVLFCLDKRNASRSAFTKGKCFTLNMLGEEQQDVSVTFSSPVEDRFASVPIETLETGVPILTGCIANLECLVDAVHEGGDHLIIVGRVEKLFHAESGRPLLYYNGRYARISD